MVMNPHKFDFQVKLQDELNKFNIDIGQGDIIQELMQERKSESDITAYVGASELQQNEVLQAVKANPVPIVSPDSSDFTKLSEHNPSPRYIESKFRKTTNDFSGYVPVLGPSRTASKPLPPVKMRT